MAWQCKKPAIVVAKLKSVGNSAIRPGDVAKLGAGRISQIEALM